MNSWIERLMAKAYLRNIMMADAYGNLAYVWPQMSSDDDLLPPMLQAFDVLAQTLSSEFGFARTQVVLIASEEDHILIFPIGDESAYLALVVTQGAPLSQLMQLGKKYLKDFNPEQIQQLIPQYEPKAPPLPLQEDTHEMISEIELWLSRHKPPSGGVTQK